MKTCYQPDLLQMRSQIEKLSKVNPKIYWIDFISTSIFSWVLFLLTVHFAFHTILHCFLVSLSAFGFYRMLLFTHELVHLKKGALPGFHLFWHVFCGLPFLAPHFLYKGTHLAHHAKSSFGTTEDGEYFQIRKNSNWMLVLHFLYNLLIPLISIFRFMFVAIISIFHPGLRKFVMKKMSFMGVTFSLTRKIPHQKSELIIWYCEEFSCTFYCWLMLALICLDILPITILFQWYGVLIFILSINSLRALTSHVYSSSGKAISFEGQIQDSIIITSNSIFTKIMCPVGSQYHALHHMFPFIPYHALGKVHQFIQKNFPNEKILKEATSASLFKAWKNAWDLHAQEKFRRDKNKTYDYIQKDIHDLHSEQI